MDELLDLTEKTPRAYETGPLGLADGPITIPIPKFAADVPPSPDRVAHGTRTRMATMPPPIPARARRTTTMPPPIPAAALRSSASIVVAPPPREEQSVEVELAEPTPAAAASEPAEPTPAAAASEPAEPAEPAELSAPAATAVPAEPAAYEPPSVLPPLPSPSQSWLSQAPPRRSTAQLFVAEPPRVHVATPAPSLPIEVVAPVRPQLTPMPPVLPAPIEAIESTPLFTRLSRDWGARHFAAVAVGAVALASVLYIALGGDHPRAATAVSAASPPATTAIAQTATTAKPPAPPPARSAPAPAAVAPAAPAAPPVHEVAPVPPAPVAAPPQLSIPVTSVPVGAVVTLVVDGNATVLGKTPVTATIDPAHSYDVVLAAVGHPTQIRHIDAGTHEVAVDFSPPRAAAAAAPVATHAIATAPVHHAAPPPARIAVADRATKPQPAAASSGSPILGGTLVISTKPPCEIVVDGKPTHMSTPQRALSLSSGRHMITLINASQKIKKTLAVQIDARKPTSISQDFTQR